eukprot:scaffold34638_cov161-Amphora_coffeaeformis.AAC.21
MPLAFILYSKICRGAPPVHVTPTGKKNRRKKLTQIPEWQRNRTTTRKTMTAPQTGRIPDSLKAVFLASNQGREVYVPPADKSAFKVFCGSRNEPGKKILRQHSNPQEGPAEKIISPQKLLHRLLKKRGYFARSYRAKDTGYYNQPTEHQLASHGPRIVEAVTKNQPNELRLMMEAGLSPNACDEHGESLLHLICRHDKVDLFHVLLAFDVDLQQTDGYGRSVMHSACWASNPSFQIARCLLKRDPTFLFLYDDRGMHPLSYVTKANWGIWEDFLEKNIDELYPTESVNKNRTPRLCTLSPNSRPVPNPKDMIEAALANMVASGALAPLDAIIALDADDETTVAASDIDPDETTYYDSSSDEEEDESESCFDDDDESDSVFDAEEEQELLELVGEMKKLKNLRSIVEDEG